MNPLQTLIVELHGALVQWEPLLLFALFCFQSQVIEFQWKDIKAYDTEEEGMSFAFEYNRPGKKPRMVQILTQYVSNFTIIILNTNAFLYKFICINTNLYMQN